MTCETAIGVNRCFAFAVLLAVNGCSPASTSRTAATMDEIEGQVQLPKGAHALADYARYYAPGRGGKVLGAYLIPIPEFAVRPGEGCAELTGKSETKGMPCAPMAVQRQRLKAGQRRWISHERDLPSIIDGGCDMVTVIFDPQMRKVEEVNCNNVT